jgi:hypothetical protein
MTAFLIAAGIASLIPISGLLWRAIGWIRERLVYRELGIVAISGIERPEPLGEARIRLAYGGNRLLLIRSVRVKFSLR